MKYTWKSVVKSQFCILFITSIYGRTVTSQSTTRSNTNILNCRESNSTHITMYATLERAFNLNTRYHIECTSVTDMKKHLFKCQCWRNQEKPDQIEIECQVLHILYPFTEIALFEDATGNNSAKQLVIKNRKIIDEKCSQMHGVQTMKLTTDLKNNWIEIDIELYTWDLLFIDKLHAYVNQSSDFINRHGVEINYLTTRRTLNRTIRLGDSRINNICQICVAVIFSPSFTHVDPKYTKCENRKCQKLPRINSPKPASMKIKPILPVIVISIFVFILIIVVYKIKGSAFCIQRQTQQLQQRPQQVAVVDIGLLIASQDPSEDNKPALPMYAYKVEDNYTPLEMIER